MHEPSFDRELEGLKYYYPPKTDILGLGSVEGAIEDFKPDRFYLTGDPGSYTAYSTVMPERIPSFAYVPIEGEPIINVHWRDLLSKTDYMTCTEYGQGVIKRQLNRDVEYAYHGVDSLFQPLAPDERRRLRERLGWTDKFVLICVATNVHRKQWPRLFEALAKLKHQLKQRDIILYAHTIPFDGHWLEGWNLPEVAYSYGVLDEVVFNPMLMRHHNFIPETGGTTDLPSLPQLYSAADLFVLASQVEGFGLPILESMACGTPVGVTQYGAGWEVAHGAGVGFGIRDWEIHKSGTKYANVDPDSIVKEVLKLKRNPNQLAALARAGLEKARRFTWDDFNQKVVDGTFKATSVLAKERGAPQEAQDRGQADQPVGSPENEASTNLLRKAAARSRPATAQV